MWVRGLKLFEQGVDHAVMKSHPMWVRGLKPGGSYQSLDEKSRTPCGCVD